LTVSILFLTRGDLPALAGVYTISFLAVMALFALGNVLLKVRRAQLPRPTQASWVTVIVGITAVVAGLIGNAIMNPPYLRVFLEYFLPALLIVSVMLGRIALLKAAFYIIRTAIMALLQPMSSASHAIRNWIEAINAQQMVFFTREDDIATLRRVMDYIRRNEHTNRVKIVTVIPEGEKPPAGLKKDLDFLDKAYPEIDIEYVILHGEFTPELIKHLAVEWKIPTNLMFIGSPRGHLTYSLAELHGVRLII
jgi:hypothetical protein